MLIFTGTPALHMRDSADEFRTKLARKLPADLREHHRSYLFALDCAKDVHTIMGHFREPQQAVLPARDRLIEVYAALAERIAYLQSPEATEVCRESIRSRAGAAVTLGKRDYLSVHEMIANTCEAVWWACHIGPDVLRFGVLVRNEQAASATHTNSKKDPESRGKPRLAAFDNPPIALPPPRWPHSGDPTWPADWNNPKKEPPWEQWEPPGSSAARLWLSVWPTGGDARESSATDQGGEPNKEQQEQDPFPTLCRIAAEQVGEAFEGRDEELEVKLLAELVYMAGLRKAAPTALGAPKDAGSREAAEAEPDAEGSQLAKAGATENGPIPPDRFCYDGGCAEELSSKQFRLMEILWGRGELPAVPISVAVDHVYQNRPRAEDPARALTEMARRVSVDKLDGHVPLLIEQNNNYLQLKVLPGARTQNTRARA
jgi:hypothetical protein